VHKDSKGILHSRSLPHLMHTGCTLSACTVVHSDSKGIPHSFSLPHLQPSSAFTAFLQPSSAFTAYLQTLSAFTVYLQPSSASFTASHFANHLLTQDCYPAKPKGQVCPNPRAKRKPPTSNRVKNRTSLPRRIWTRGIWAIRRSPTMTARRSEQRPTLRPARSQEAP